MKQHLKTTSPVLPNDEFLNARRDAIARRDWRRYLMTFNGHERVLPFESILCMMTDVEYWLNLTEVWQHTEFVGPEYTLWERLLFSTREKSGALAIMEKGERGIWEALPNTITVFRGQQTEQECKGFSWTLSRERAEWFAFHRSQTRMGLVTEGLWKKGKGVVLSGLVQKADVLCFLDSRSEQEILVHPDSVKHLGRGDCGPTEA